MPVNCDTLTVKPGTVIAAAPVADLVDHILRDVREGDLPYSDKLSDRLQALLDHCKGGPLPL